MEPLLEQLKSLPQRWSALSRGTRLAAVLALFGLGAVSAVAWVLSGGADSYQYAFTNLSPEDAQAATAALKSSGIPFRAEAGGTAVAVPSGKVYDARLLLAAQGLPRAAGVGFELFDRGQFGVSEFTQRVNLRRAIEGELARTVGSLSEVRSARVHLSLGERGLYRDEDKRATASVVVTLQPSRALSGGQLSGIRHLVASAVPGLSPDAVTVVDGRGAVLGGVGDGSGEGGGFERETEAQLQQRVVSLLEPVVGAGAVVARVAVTADLSEVSQQSEVFDPDQVALRSEKTSAGTQGSENGSAGAVAGAAANTPNQPQQAGGGTRAKSQSSTHDEQRSWEITKTQTTTVIKKPRIRRLSAAVLLDQPKGSSRDAAELERLTELTKKAIGFDEARGDQLQLSSAPFTRAESADTAPSAAGPSYPAWAPYAAAGGLGLLVLVGLFLALRRGGKQKAAAPQLQLTPGLKVSELEAQVLPAKAAEPLPAQAASAAAKALEAVKASAALPADVAVREKAAAHAKKDPVKTAQLIRAWIAADVEAAKEARRG